MKVYAAVIYGFGGKTVSQILSGDGTGKLVLKMQALGIKARLFDHYETTLVAERIRAQEPDTKIIIGGTSLGACNSPLVGLRAGRQVDYMFGIQPSLYGIRADYSPNVAVARCIYNPVWFLTFGLGARVLVPADGNTTTVVKYTKSYALHPGDAGADVHYTILNDLREQGLAAT